MPNHRQICPYCKNTVLCRDFGLHILRKHEALLFGDKDNNKTLHRDKYFKEPLLLSLGDDPYHFCLADNSCIKKAITAETHFKGKAEAHKEAILKLREKYPLDTPLQETGGGGGGAALTSKQRQKLQDWMAFLWSEYKDITFSNSERKVFDELGIKTKLEDLKELYPDTFAEEEEEEEEEPPEEQPPEEPLPDLFAAPEDEETEATPLPIPEPVVEQPPPPPPMMPKPVIPPKHLLYHNFTVKPPEPTFPKLIQNTKQMKG